MCRAGLANQPTSISRDDGLELRGAYVTAAVRCAPPDNKPTPAERDECLPFLARELALLTQTRVIVCLGSFAYQSVSSILGVRPRPKFGHGVEARIDAERVIVCSFHPSQQNTFTGRLTEAMLDDVFHRALRLASSSPI
jgi:uracil-DNA glycosylase family 4